ncbi:MAG: hypothetical protein IJI58_00485 [Bacilli bacterium]|nr:hypothetical protein [Bacilli bacterium]
MSRVDESNLLLEIESINDYIDNFELERKSGTKALKKKFHKEAVEGRNGYVKEKIDLYEKYKRILLVELENRSNVLLPQNKNDKYAERKAQLNKLQELLIYKNPFVSNNFRLGFYRLIYAIKENTSLEELNSIVDNYVAIFTRMGIKLSAEDFDYTMFTKDYFSTYFGSVEAADRKAKFDKVYWECPKLVLEIKQCLLAILKKYEKKINEYTKVHEGELVRENEVDIAHIEEVYNLTRKSLEDDIDSDEYTILDDFLKGNHSINDYLKDSASRGKIFDSFVASGSYEELSVDDKLKFKENIVELYHTLNILKKYYKYETIITDLVEKYNNRATVKGNFANLEKELDKDDKEREKLNKEYEKSCGIGFLAKESSDKQNLAKVKSNEIFDKLMTDLANYDEAKISVDLDKNLKESANVHDLFKVALSSYSYLVRTLTKINEEDPNFDLEKEIDDYIDFVCDPNGNFLDGIFAFNNLDITETISKKYRLVGINITKEKIDREVIDTLLNDVSLIYLIQNIENNSITMENIKFICDVNKIKPIDLSSGLI